MDVNEADFLPTAQELNPASVHDFEERENAVATPEKDSASTYSKRRKTYLSRNKITCDPEKEGISCRR